MSAFYDLASLVVVPSGYKAQKIYAQKPLTTDGQLAFTRSTTATRVNASGLIETVAVNVPRLDYLGSTCGKLLLEPQRTNLVTFSEQIDNAGWTKDGTTTTANQTTSPDGYNNADLITAITGLSDRTIYQLHSITVQPYTVSVYVKKNTQRYVHLTLNRQTDASEWATSNFDLDTATSSNYSSIMAAPTSTITSVGSGWFRITMTATTSNAATHILISGFSKAGAPDASRGRYNTDSTNSFYVWGFQMEAGAYPTSLIPTLSAAVTRGADAAFKAGISSLIGQTEGTIFFDLPPTTFSPTLSTYVLLELDGNIGAGYIHLYKEVGQKEARFTARNGSTLICSIHFTLSDDTPYKIAAVYKNDRFELWVNGVLRGSDTTGTLASITMNKIQMASDSFNANSQIMCSQMILFKTALTNAQLAELTTI